MKLKRIELALARWRDLRARLRNTKEEELILDCRQAELEAYLQRVYLFTPDEAHRLASAARSSISQS